MMDLQSIRDLSRKAAAQARRDKREPFTIEAHDLASLDEFLQTAPHIAFLGTYLPHQWRRVDLRDWFGDDRPRGVYYDDNDGFGAFFVDNSGVGRHDEPALPVDALFRLIRPGYGYAIVEAGQFQVKIGAFQKLDS